MFSYLIHLLVLIFEVGIFAQCVSWAVPAQHPATGKFRGFIVVVPPKENRMGRCSPVVNMDFRREDIIVELNGVRLNAATDGLKAFQAIRNADVIKARVLRGGQEIVLEGKSAKNPCPQEVEAETCL